MYLQTYLKTKKAITETIRICKDKNVLKKYLENREQEVIDIIMTLFDDKQILKAYAKDIKDTTEREAAIKLIKKGKMTLEDIAECIPLTLEELKKLKEEI